MSYRHLGQENDQESSEFDSNLKPNALADYQVKPNTSPEQNFVFVHDTPRQAVDVEIIDEELNDTIEVEANRVNSSKSKTKVNYGNYPLNDEDSPMAADKIGRKNYDNGKLNLAKLRKNLFGNGVKGIGKSILAVFAIVLVIILGASVTGVAYVANLYQTTSIDYSKPLSKSTVILARDGTTELFKIFGDDGKRQEIRSLDDLNDYTYLSFLALEDENYYKNNNGISWYNLAGAIGKCGISIGKDCRGGSGISQQLVRQITGDDTRDRDQVAQRKLREIVRAYKLNEELSQEEILLKYINTVNFGRNAYGIKEAAITFLGQEDLKKLTPAESCYLASVLPSPNNYSAAFYNPESPFREIVENRKNNCLQKLADLPLRGPSTAPVITQQDVEVFKQAKVEFKTYKNAYKYPHFVEYVRQELIRVLANGDESEQGKDTAEKLLSTNGYRVTTTIDPALQDKVEKVITDQTQKNILDLGANNAAALVLDGPSGEILSMVGSRDYNNEGIKGKVNVTTTPQQPGSSFKPYVYAAAFEQGFNPGTILMDVDTTFDNGAGSKYSPNNFTGRFTGPVSVRYSIANSLNIPAVKSVWLAAGNDYGNNINEVRKAGIQKVIDRAEKMGVKFQVYNNQQVATHRQTCGPQLALGGCEVSAVSHAEGMNTFAQLGNRVPATPFLKICNSINQDIYNGKMCDGKETTGIQNIKNDFYKKDDKALDPRIAWQIADIMTDVEARKPVFGSTRFTLTLPDRKVAAKTGTSNDNRDTWTVGFTPQRTAVVWVGNTDNTPTKDSSMRSAAPIWQNIMKAAVDGTAKEDFKRPDNMVNVKLSTLTGLPADDGQGTWLTPEQKKLLDDAVGKGTPKDGNKFDLSKEDIFSLRTPLFGRFYTVNKVDKKLVTDENKDRIEPSNITEQYFLCPASEFPWAKNWYDPVVNFMNGFRSDKAEVACGPTELSTSYRADSTPIDKQPKLTFSGFQDGGANNQYPLSVILEGVSTVPGAKIVSTKIIVNDVVVVEGPGAGTRWVVEGTGPASGNPELKRIVFSALDSLGNVVYSPTYTLTLYNVNDPLPNQAGAQPSQPSKNTGPQFVSPQDGDNVEQGKTRTFSVTSGVPFDEAPTITISNGTNSTPDIPLNSSTPNTYSNVVGIPPFGPGKYIVTLAGSISGSKVGLQITMNVT